MTTTAKDGRLTTSHQSAFGGLPQMVLQIRVLLETTGNKIVTALLESTGGKLLEATPILGGIRWTICSSTDYSKRTFLYFLSTGQMCLTNSPRLDTQVLLEATIYEAHFAKELTSLGEDLMSIFYGTS